MHPNEVGIFAWLRASGEGSRDAMAGVAGMLAGAEVFVAAYPWLEPIIQAGGNLGEKALPDLLGVQPWIVILAMAMAVLAVFALIERLERPGASSGRTTPQRSGWTWLSGSAMSGRK